MNNKNIVSLGNTTKNVKTKIYLIIFLIADVYKDYLKISKKVCEAIENDFIPVILGGDHSLSIGSVNGTSSFFAKSSSEIGVIWIDAHPDINTPLTSSSGNMHGQPVSFLLHELDEYLPKLKGFEWAKSWF